MANPSPGGTLGGVCGGLAASEKAGDEVEDDHLEENGASDLKPARPSLLLLLLLLLVCLLLRGGRRGGLLRRLGFGRHRWISKLQYARGDTERNAQLDQHRFSVRVPRVLRRRIRSRTE